MLRITHGEESKLTSWYFEIDRGLLGCVILLIFIGMLMVLSAGSAEATRLSKPWFYFIQKAAPFYLIGLTALFGISMLNRKWIMRIAVLMLIVGIIGLGITVLEPGKINGSHRWANVFGVTFMPSDVLKPAFIMITAWFLTKLHERYGTDIFLNKEVFKINQFGWLPYLLIMLICMGIIFWHPDVGTAVLFAGIFLVMILVAGVPLRWFIPLSIGGIGLIGGVALMSMSHIKLRVAQIFNVVPRTQVWYSLNSIRHGGLFGSGDKSYVKDALPEATNDFIFSAIAEDWGAIAACALIVFLFVIFANLINRAVRAKDDFVIYALAGTAALFAGQICFNLATALHIVINKGMTLPFVSYGGGSFVCFCILFGMVLALIREDTWK